jgi:hypothetical protein
MEFNAWIDQIPAIANMRAKIKNPDIILNLKLMFALQFFRLNVNDEHLSLTIPSAYQLFGKDDTTFISE